MYTQQPKINQPRAYLLCNRYSQTASISDLKSLMNSISLNVISELPATFDSDIYPDKDAPIIRKVGEHEAKISIARWGFPPVKNNSSPITNIRNLSSSWWQKVNGKYLFEPEYRCLVPFTRFAEPPKHPTWFSPVNQNIAMFAGIWRPWHGERLVQIDGKVRRTRREGDFELFAFLTTDANGIVRPVHEKAMPVVLTEPQEWQKWLSGGSHSLYLQRPLPNNKLRIN